MLRIQVLGTGMIPRGLGLAPRKEPFYADLTLIGTILSTPGLTVNMIHPGNGRIIEVTSSNCKSMYQKYSDENYHFNNSSNPEVESKDKDSSSDEKKEDK